MAIKSDRIKGIQVVDGKEYWTGQRMADMLGISLQRLLKLVEMNIVTPVMLQSGRAAKARRYDPALTFRQYLDYKTQGPAEGTVSDYKKQIDKYRAALVEQQYEAQKYKNEINSGELIYASQVTEEKRTFFSAFKRFALSIPSRVTGMISGLLPPLEIRRISQELTKEMTAQLTGFVDAATVDEDEDEDEGDEDV